MSEQTQVERRRLSIVTAGRRHDVVVDVRARLGDVLDQLGVAADGEGLTPDGTRLARDVRLGSQRTPDGVVLTVVDGEGVVPTRVRSGARSTAHAPGSRRAVTTPDPAPAPPAPTVAPALGRDVATGHDTAASPRPWLAGAVALLLPVLAAAAILLAGTEGAAVLVGGVLLAGALVAAWSAAGIGVRSAAVLGAAIGAGLLVLGLTADLPAGAGHLAVAGGGLGAALCAVLGRHTDPLVRQTARTVVTVGLLTALGAAVALVAAVPVTVLAVAAAGLAVVVARILPDVVMGGDDASPLDRLATTAWSPRPRPARRRSGPVARAELEGRVQVAALHQRCVLAGILLALLVASLTLVVSRPGSVLATTVALGVTGAGLGLVARRYHARVDRWLLRVAGIAALAGAWVLGTGALPAGPAAGLTAVVLVVAGLLVALAPAVGRGWTSLALGRVADLLEGLCVAAALPLAAWAAGLVPWLRNLMA